VVKVAGLADFSFLGKQAQVRGGLPYPMGV
jgi:hypothetical protein